MFSDEFFYFFNSFLNRDKQILSLERRPHLEELCPEKKQEFKKCPFVLVVYARLIV